MDFANRGNKPAGASHDSGAPQNNGQPSAPSFQPTNKHTSNNNGNHHHLGVNKYVAGFMVITIAILILATLMIMIFGGDSKKYYEEDLINRDKYQAVFLDSPDGQVYFGKLGVFDENIYALTDIYYVRVEQPIQPQTNQVAQPNISLAKLGNELHGPEDVMYIRRDQVLYWENLKDDGQVVSAIKDFQENGAPAPAPAPAEDDSTDDASGTAEEGSDNADQSDTDTTDEDAPATP